MDRLLSTPRCSGEDILLGEEELRSQEEAGRRVDMVDQLEEEREKMAPILPLLPPSYPFAFRGNCSELGGGGGGGRGTHTKDRLDLRHLGIKDRHMICNTLIKNIYIYEDRCRLWGWSCFPRAEQGTRQSRPHSRFGSGKCLVQVNGKHVTNKNTKIEKHPDVHF